jgi:hypothetical protein
LSETTNRSGGKEASNELFTQMGRLNYGTRPALEQGELKQGGAEKNNKSVDIFSNEWRCIM